MGQTMTLGELIDGLQAAPRKDVEVVFDFCGIIPTTFDSWRGVYADLALGWEVEQWDHERKAYNTCTVGELLERANNAIDTTFHGYKGGEYQMGGDTPVWVDNYGEYTLTALAEVHANDYRCVLVTRRDTGGW